MGELFLDSGNPVRPSTRSCMSFSVQHGASAADILRALHLFQNARSDFDTFRKTPLSVKDGGRGA
jgi:hypothetical protein